MTDNNDRKWLEKRLGDFLGFQDDSLSDVLDHLLSIEGDRDLLDYLEQLLGSRSDDVRVFVKDIGRYRQGLPLLLGIKLEEANDEKSTSKVSDHKNYETERAVKTSTNNKKIVAKDVLPPAPAGSTTPKETATTTQPSKASISSTKAEAKNGTAEPAKEFAEAAPSGSTHPKPSPPEKKFGLPPKGKAKRNCGCFGTFHKPLTNCLYCGRISCVDEGYDFCPFCGYLVEEVKPPEGENDSEAVRAWLHKERLLRYDRNSAQRTVVLDDQADYYSNQTSNWLTEDEQEDAALQDEEQRNNLHHRKRQTLNIAF